MIVDGVSLCTVWFLFMESVSSSGSSRSVEFGCWWGVLIRCVELNDGYFSAAKIRGRGPMKPLERYSGFRVLFAGCVSVWVCVCVCAKIRLWLARALDVVRNAVCGSWAARGLCKFHVNSWKMGGHLSSIVFDGSSPKLNGALSCPSCPELQGQSHR